MVERADEMLHFLVLFIAEQQPVEALRIVPLDELCKFIAHEIELLAGVRDLIGEKRAQIVEFIVVIARHFIDERAFAVHDLIVAERQNKILGIGIRHGERQRVMVALSPQRIERHILEHIVHPAHVPFEQEAEAAIIIRLGDQRKGCGFLSDHHDRRIGLERSLVEPAQKLDRFEIFPAPKFVGLELSAIIVQIQHGRNCIDSNSVDVKITEPVADVGDEEGLHLRLAVIVDTGHPVWVLVHHRVGKLVAAGPVKLKQAVFVLREVRRHPVEDDADPGLMAGVDKLHELLRRPVAVGRGEIAGDLIAPRGVVGIFHDGQQLDMRIAHILDIGNQLRRKLLIIEIAAVFMPFPRACVDLVDIDRTFDRGLLCGAGTIERVMPLEAVRRIDHAGGVRQRAAAVCVGIGLVDYAAVRAGHAVFIGLSCLRIDGDGLPYALRDLLHGKILRIPEIKVADDAYGLRVRRPDAEHKSLAVLARVTAEKFTGVCRRARMEPF